jgi:murein DD-endopeptidase MepM/ murein hydrolase activator NlpD
MHIRTRRLAAVSAVCAVVMAGAPPAAAAPRPSAASVHHTADLTVTGWVWPLERWRLARAYVAPPHRYGPGHRGVDLAPVGPGVVRAPAPGVVAFSGPVAGRGILTIDHGDGLVTTLEPVDSELRPGDAVAQGAPVAVVALGGHSEPGLVHFGVRRHGEYINPMLLLGGVPRAVLLPCC